MVEPGSVRVCQFFLRGRCHRLKCEFRHPQEEKEKSVPEDISTISGGGDTSSVLNQTENDTVYVPHATTKKKFLNIEPAENVPKNFAAYLDDSTASSVEESPLKAAHTSVIVGPKAVISEQTNGKHEKEIDIVSKSTEEFKTEDKVEQEEQTNLHPPTELISEQVEEPELEEKKSTITVADLVEEAEKEEIVPEKEVITEDPAKIMEEIIKAHEKAEEVIQPVVLETPVNLSEVLGTAALDTTEEAEDEEEEIKEIEEEKPTENINTQDNTLKVKSSEEEELPLTHNPKIKTYTAKKPTNTPTVVSTAKSTPVATVKAARAAELEQDWDDDGDEDEPTDNQFESQESAGEKNEIPLVTPRKSSRAPKPTEKKIESQKQKDFKPEDMEESVDAIAKELERPESDVKKSSKKDNSPKGKGRKGQGENKEDWVTLIFGENGEKVTEKGKKKGDTSADDDKSEQELPEAEEFLMDQTPFQSGKNKRQGRPKKKDLDEKMDGVSKLGSNMYFYTGPGGGQGGGETPPSLHSDDEDMPAKKMGEKQAESARKSGRAGKGRNRRLERDDEVVDLPQTKAKEASLNPSWLKNHDAKNTPAVKKPTNTPTVASTIKSTPVIVSSKRKTTASKEEVEAAAEEIASAMESENSKNATPVKDIDSDLPEFDPDKFTPGYVPKTVIKGGHEYQIVVEGVKDTGLCGNYWGDLSNLPNRRRSKAPEPLQAGPANEATPVDKSRRSSVGSVGSQETPTGRKTPQAKRITATSTPAPPPQPQPKSSKKQATKPERRVETMDSSQSESEPEQDAGNRGQKRKAETKTPDKEVKRGKKEQPTLAQEEEEEELKATFSDYDSASGTTETTPLRTTKRPSSKESPAKETTKESDNDSPLTSKQQTAVNAALAAGVPAGQQRSVSCVADTSTQREVVVECFAPYDDHRWVNIGKERDGMAPDAVQYARALRPPYHLLSFLRIKGHSTKGMSCTDKNTMVFVVLEGEITVILHTTQFNAKKGDSFYIPPKNYYNLINQKAREAELSLIQFQYDGPLPTVQPSQAS